MSDIVERLRENATNLDCFNDPYPDVLTDAADEIERLRAALHTARAAALEEAALLIERDADAAEARWETINDSFGIGSRHVSTLRQYAAAIRALKGGKR